MRTLTALLLLVVLVVVPAPTAQAAPPVEFDKTLLADGLDMPTAFRFAPDGRILIGEKNGAIRLIKNGVLQTAPMITLPTANADERGLLGLELDPDFATNHHVYVAYTRSDNFNRLSRFTVTGDTIAAASELVLIQSNQQSNVFHHGGELRFLPDGKLYWSLGMNTYNPNSQNLGTPHGKILRVNKDGTIPPDNPFAATPGAERSIWAYGLRNPFRWDVVPDGPNAGKILTGDVGGSEWEEINLIEKGANYGWPLAEGFCAGCGYANPVHTYPHTAPPAAAGSVTSLEIYTGGTFPAEYDNAVFFADYTLGFIKYLKMDEEFKSVISVNDFDLNAGTPVQLSTGPDGNLYQLNIYPGAFYKIAPSGGNRAPVAKATATPSDGLGPLEVHFSSLGSGDPDEGDDVTYLWDFRDGTTSTEPGPTHTYTTNGVYDVTLTVSDGAKSTQATVKVTVGNRRPTGTITAPVSLSTYDAGDVITYAATGTDPEDGTLPASAFSWSVVFHHADHVHPFLGPVNGVRGGTFTIPRVADNVATTWYRVQLTVTDAGGLQHTSFVDVKPNLVELTFTSDPLGPTYTVDGVPFTGTKVEQAVVGVERVLSAPATQFHNGKQYAWQGWSDEGEITHTIVTPGEDTVYAADFLELTQPPAPWASADIGPRTVAGTTYYDAGSFTIKGGGNDVWDQTDEFRYVFQPLQGDGTIIARLTEQTDTHPWAKAGVMIKESATPMAKYAAVALTPENGMHFQYDFQGDGGGYPSLGGWMKLTRTGDVFTAFRSADGVVWTAIGTTTLPMAAQATIGLWVSSHDMTALSAATFENVQVTQGSTVGPVPAPWTRADVDGATPAGSATYDSANGTFTVNGGGTDVWADTEEHSFLNRPLTGDGSITARITSQSETAPWAKAGLMIKGPESYADLFVTPENGMHFQTSDPSSVVGGPFTFPDAWARLTREGDVIKAYRSPDGENWILVGQHTLPGLPETVAAGMFVTAHRDGTVLGTATFDHVTFESADDPGLPALWTGGDVGAPVLPGSSGELGGVFSITAGGDDVWGTTDQMHFVRRPLTGDGTIVARVNSLTRAEAWTKAGVMFKETSVSGSPYAALLLSADHGVHLQTTGEQDVTGTDLDPPGVWLKLVRAGNTFTAFDSGDGVTWTRVGARTVTMAAAAQVGLFAVSHDGSQTTTATFSDVTVTPANTTGLPAGWNSVDVGGPALAGTASVNGRTFTISGAGGDVWGTADQMHYVYRDLPANGTIVARVISQENTDDWAKSGLMIKSAATALSPYSGVFLTPAHGIHQQANFNSDADGGAATAPVWLRVSRVGSTVTTYRSANGEDWTAIGTATLAGPATIGLFVCSHEAGQLNTTVFDQVLVS
ncbi:PKD domain-containing protein [Herbidospora sp. NEAU-GS84]|uniref:PKD domain-containing protein n=1 Tax=Herbidospora solisilvae TaxID=2696284 RepID=A0A7C9NNY4_9ACTN|nr:PQQ-dependent sugar dehydrogenase [Herbidospora solisilvae]NAS23276.1 PKD domain-containing protein [Herbidospora solisilvae]